MNVILAENDVNTKVDHYTPHFQNIQRRHREQKECSRGIHISVKRFRCHIDE